MPIYEYQCQQCEERSEEMQGVNDPPLETCGKCGGTLRKLISAPAFQLKGTGWYVTDYGKGGSTGSPASGESSDASSSGGGDESSAKKVDTKTESKTSGAKEKSA